MRPPPTAGRHLAGPPRVLHALLALTLAAALLAPKVSLALAAAFGDGYTSVVVCTGTGLERVTVSPDGEIVGLDDVSEHWVGAHCVLPDDDAQRLERAWRRFEFPRLDAVAVTFPVPTAPSPRALRPAAASRAPPAI